ncbi:hypothetical protein AcV7_002731 [Taiwanofungus camphoratus]|nr:hypothetical protein AcV7_002731 [Antrodia cinnamomea]
MQTAHDAHLDNLAVLWRTRIVVQRIVRRVHRPAVCALRQSEPARRRGPLPARARVALGRDQRHVRAKDVERHADEKEARHLAAERAPRPDQSRVRTESLDAPRAPAAAISVGEELALLLRHGSCQVTSVTNAQGRRQGRASAGRTAGTFVDDPSVIRCQTPLFLSWSGLQLSIGTRETRSPAADGLRAGGSLAVCAECSGGQSRKTGKFTLNERDRSVLGVSSPASSFLSANAPSACWALISTATAISSSTDATSHILRLASGNALRQPSLSPRRLERDCSHAQPTRRHAAAGALALRAPPVQPQPTPQARHGSPQRHHASFPAFPGPGPGTRPVAHALLPQIHPPSAPWPRSTTPSHSQTKGSASARPARSSGANRGERPVELQDLWECLEHGGRGGLGVGGLAFAIPSGVNPLLRMTRIDNVPR